MIHFIVFSRNRPLQLHGYLSSLRTYIRGDAAVDVLMRSDPEYVDAYGAVKREFDDVRFFEEDDFSANMQALTVIPSEYICFGCDDVIFQRPVDVRHVEQLLSDQQYIGISLRLGKHITHGMFWNQQPQPAFTERYPFLTWDMTPATGDWAYPWDVLGTIYRHQFVQDMWPHLQHAENPSQYEEAGSQVWRSVTRQHHYACWSDSRTTIPTPNVVQQQFGNGYVGKGELEPGFLLDCWQHNLRMDVERFSGRYSTWRISDFHLTRVTG